MCVFCYVCLPPLSLSLSFLESERAGIKRFRIVMKWNTSTNFSKFTRFICIHYFFRRELCVVKLFQKLDAYLLAGFWVPPERGLAIAPGSRMARSVGLLSTTWLIFALWSSVLLGFLDCLFLLFLLADSECRNFLVWRKLEGAMDV